MAVVAIMRLCFEKPSFPYKTLHKGQNSSGIGTGGPSLLGSFLSHMPQPSCFFQMRIWKHFWGNEGKHLLFGPLPWLLLLLDNFTI